MSGRYDHDVLAAGGPPRIARIPEIAADPGIVVEDAATGWCGAVVEVGKDLVLLEDRFGKRRAFALEPAAFRFEGKLCTLVKPKTQRPRRSAADRVGLAWPSPTPPPGSPGQPAAGRGPARRRPHRADLGR